MSKFEIGQKVVLALKSYRQPNECNLYSGVIVNIGRKWATVEYDVDSRWGARRTHRFDMTNSQHLIDGGEFSSVGSVFQNEEEYHSHKKAMEVWNNFKRMTPFSIPREVTADDIRMFAKKIGLEL